MKIIKFEDLQIWKDSMQLTKSIYSITAKGEFSKDWGLRDQIRRAVISISSNIVEGFEKSNNNEFSRFLKISKGSIGEVRNQLYVALLLKYIDKSEFNALNKSLKELANQVGKLIVYLQNFKSQKQLATRNSSTRNS